MDIPVSIDELKIATKVLQLLESKHLKHIDKEFTDAGIKLFSRVIRKQIYENNNDLVEHIKNQTNHNKVLKKLEKIYNEIQTTHANNVEISRSAGINEMRDTREAEINSKGLIALTTQSNIMTLMQSAYYNHDTNNGLIDYMIQSTNINTISDTKVSESLVKSFTNGNEKGNNHIVDNDFRIGGLGRSRHRKSKFSKDRIRGKYDDIDNDNEDTEDNENIRKKGKVYLVPRNTMELGYLCYVEDDEDSTKRACSKRVIVDLIDEFSCIGMELSKNKIIDYPCTYIRGQRKQIWAYLGGEIEGLSGETAISIRLIKSNSNSEYVIPPIGSFRRHCNICKQPYEIIHHFYHQLCNNCGDFNLQKRLQTSNLQGYVALVTGGRVRIGFQICLRLLRAGATVIATTRWIKDAALRYSNELDFNDWKHRLSIEKLELTDIMSVEIFCKNLCKTYKRIHILINNAAQTITRPQDWNAKMDYIEQQTTCLLSDDAKKLLSSTALSSLKLLTDGDDIASDGNVTNDDSSKLITRNATRNGLILLDECGQPLDQSGTNSWSKRLGEIDTYEMAQTLAVNAMSPFVLCSKLLELLKSGINDEDIKYSHIVNVTALEGKFNVGKKSGGHVHTNMSKAALNMLTLTSSRDYARMGIIMNCCDTGWCTDMSPHGIGNVNRTHETFVGPPLDDEDGASRVLDPIFTFLNEYRKSNRNDKIKINFGNFYKDYYKASW